jgi:hypothetical protein
MDFCRQRDSQRMIQTRISNRHGWNIFNCECCSRAAVKGNPRPHELTGFPGPGNNPDAVSYSIIITGHRIFKISPILLGNPFLCASHHYHHRSNHTVSQKDLNFAIAVSGSMCQFAPLSHDFAGLVFILSTSINSLQHGKSTGRKY